MEIKLSLAAPIQTVWDALTDATKVAQWWAAGLIEPREGGRFCLDGGEELNGVVKLCHSPYILEFSWHENPESAENPQLLDGTTKSTVRFDLTETGEASTALNFIQYLPPAQIVGAAAGWHEIVGERLRSYVEMGEVADNPKRFEELQALYGKSGTR